MCRKREGGTGPEACARSYTMLPQWGWFAYERGLRMGCIYEMGVCVCVCIASGNLPRRRAMSICRAHLKLLYIKSYTYIAVAPNLRAEENSRLLDCISNIIFPFYTCATTTPPPPFSFLSYMSFPLFFRDAIRLLESWVNFFILFLLKKKKTKERNTSAFARGGGIRCFQLSL